MQQNNEDDYDHDDEENSLLMGENKENEYPGVYTQQPSSALNMSGANSNLSNLN